MALSKREVEYLRSATTAEDQLVRDVRQMLETAKRDIIAELGRSPSEWRTQYLDQLLNRTNGILIALAPAMIALLDLGATDAISRAAGLTRPLNVSGIVMGSQVEIDPNLLRSLAQYRADLIGGVTDATMDRVTEIIRRSMLTGRSLQDVERDLGSAIRERGAFRSLGARAETIARTEYGRILGAATQQGMENAAAFVPGLKKKWVTANMGGITRGRGKIARNVRPAHAAAAGQIVPFDKPFIVGGEKLMFPRDPAGSAGNVCNCRCVSVPVVPDPEL